MALVCALAGCTDHTSPTVKVDGKITFKGQPPPAGGRITFASVGASEGLPSRPGSGEFGPDGAFTLTTFKPGDGLIPGKYRANIECWRELPTLATALSANYVPATFHPEVTIDREQGEPVKVEIDVPVAVPNNPAR